MTTVVVIAKECAPGRVKTRLSPALTPVEAAGLALVSLRQTLDVVRALGGVERVLLLDGAPTGLDTTGFRVVPQVAGGLDERIAAALDEVRGPVLLIGMDTPQVTEELLRRVLDDPAGEAWFGPATDGGFWALGLRAPAGDLVRGVPMSRDDTGDRQLERLRAAGLAVRLLPPLIDVDTVEDAATVAALVPGSPFADAVAALGLPRGPGPGVRT